MPGRPPLRIRAGLDLAAAVALSVAAPWILFQMPEGSFARAALGAAAILVLPGYLLLQAIEPGRRLAWRHLALCVGFSLPLLGLGTLITVGLPGGLTATNIALVQAVLAVAMGAVAWLRRPAGDSAPHVPFASPMRMPAAAGAGASTPVHKHENPPSLQRPPRPFRSPAAAPAPPAFHVQEAKVPQASDGSGKKSSAALEASLGSPAAQSIADLVPVPDPAVAPVTPAPLLVLVPDAAPAQAAVTEPKAEAAPSPAAPELPTAVAPEAAPPAPKVVPIGPSTSSVPEAVVPATSAPDAAPKQDPVIEPPAAGPALLPPATPAATPAATPVPAPASLASPGSGPEPAPAPPSTSEPVPAPLLPSETAPTTATGQASTLPPAVEPTAASPPASPPQVPADGLKAPVAAE